LSGFRRALTWHLICSTLQAMSLIRGLFWFALFVFFTFCFIVLFEYGTHDFVPGFHKEYERVVAFVKQIDKPAAKPKK
jgi:hypothetical protein